MTMPTTTPNAPALIEGGDVMAQALDNLRSHEAMAEGAYSQNTLKAWEADSRLWSAWCAGHGRNPLPASPTDLAEWIESMAGKGNRIASIRRRIATIARMHRAAGLARSDQDRRRDAPPQGRRPAHRIAPASGPADHLP